ncbi:MAG: hypothetical protein M3299_11075 [Thermoproteota archaeon]|nr:hypothetical protein [Thermoproteota archaeon]
MLVSKQERGLLFSAACHRVLGQVAAINWISRMKKFLNDCAVLFSPLKDNQA